MGRILSAAQLEKKLTQRKEREAYKLAQSKLPTVSKPYKAKGDSNTVYVRSMENFSAVVKIPVLAESIAAVNPFVTQLGWLTQVEVEALTATSILGFKEGHKQVMRIRVNIALAAPNPKNTPWGTRVVDMIDSSFQIPFSLGADATPTLQEAKSVFNTLFAKGNAGGNLIIKKASYAELLYRGKVISVMR